MKPPYGLQLVDSHQHVFWHGGDDADLIEDMNQFGIETAWLLTSERPSHSANMAVYDPRGKGRHGEGRPTLSLDGVIEAYRRYPDRFVPGYCPNPMDPQAVKKLTAAIEIHRVRVCGEWKFATLFDDPRCIEMFRLAGMRGVPVVLHLGVPFLPPEGGTYVGDDHWKGGSIDNLERALIACPDTNFIGHAPGFWRELSGDANTYGEPYLKPPLKPGGRLIEFMDRHTNLYADLSAGSALRALSADVKLSREWLISRSHKFLFGRDYYGSALLQFLLELDLPRKVWYAIGRENAERLLAETAL